MQLFLSSIWARVAVSISYDDNHYTTGIIIVFLKPYSSMQIVCIWWLINGIIQANLS